MAYINLQNRKNKETHNAYRIFNYFDIRLSLHILFCFIYFYSLYGNNFVNISVCSGSKYEDNQEQVRGGSLSTAILNRNNPKLPQQTASTTHASVRNILSTLN